MLHRVSSSLLRVARCATRRQLCGGHNLWSRQLSGRDRLPQSDAFCVSDEVKAAISEGKPVVALETAILTHGLPPPHNLDAAFAVEARIRAEGAIPATVGVLNGKLVVGLSPAELTRLSDAAQQKTAVKVSRRDMAAALSTGAAGGTTVSGTMLAASLAGIPVFVTGGIGGVHRGGHVSLDVSADLTELGRTPVAVICAGCKSILDIGRTLEYLETQGVPTVVLGNKRSFPAFFVANSGFEGSHSVKSSQEAASMIHQSLRLGLDSGMVFGVPIPQESAADGEVVEEAIQQALHEADKAGVTGSKITPFVLSHVNKLTQGKSLAANLALIKNNAQIGARIAVELSRLGSGGRNGGGGDRVPEAFVPRNAWPDGSLHPLAAGVGMQNASFPSMASLQRPVLDGVECSSTSPGHTATAQDIQDELDGEFLQIAGEPSSHSNGRPSHLGVRQLHTVATRTGCHTDRHCVAPQQVQALRKSSTMARREPVVVGAAISDLVARATSGEVKPHITNPSVLTRGFGGVGRNVAEAMIRFGTSPFFLSAVGDDFIHHDLVRNWVEPLGADASGIRVVPGEQTAVCIVVLHQNGELHTGLGSFDVLKHISPDWLGRFEEKLKAAEIVCLDGNLSEEAIAFICSTCNASRVPIWFEPTDTGKAKKPFADSSSWRSITVASPNLFELQSMAEAVLQCESLSANAEQLSALHAQPSDLNLMEKLNVCERLAPLLLPHIPWLLVTLGAHGVLLLTPSSLPVNAHSSWSEQLRKKASSTNGEFHAEWYNVVSDKRTVDIVSVSGAGDSLAGAALASLAQGLPVSECLARGLWAAQRSLVTALPINPQIGQEAFLKDCNSAPASYVDVHIGWKNIINEATKSCWRTCHDDGFSCYSLPQKRVASESPSHSFPQLSHSQSCTIFVQFWKFP